MSTTTTSYSIQNFDRGMNNLVPDAELIVRTRRGEEGQFLRDAVNVDLLSGQLERRQGYTLVVAGTDCHSAWASLGQLLYVDAGQLKRLGGPTLHSGLAAARRVSYAQLPSSVMFSDGVLLLELIGDTVTSPAAPPADLTHDPLTRMPGMTQLAFLNGRLFGASGNLLLFSEPYIPGWYNAGRDFIAFPEPVTMIEPCQNGVFVSADQTYWIAGNPLEAELNPVLPYRAVRGAHGPVPNKNECFWLSERGIVVGMQTGEVKNLQEESVATGGGEEGAVMFREEHGVKQFVAAVSGPGETVMAARSFMDAEVIRKETIL